MNTSEILTSMARYIHAVYDIEIDDKNPNLNIKVKKYVKKFSDTDETLNSYWDSYRNTLIGNVSSDSTEPTKTEKNLEQTTSTYRGAELKVGSQNKQTTIKKSEVLYRGQTL